MATPEKKTNVSAVEAEFEKAFANAVGDRIYCSVGKAIFNHEAGAVIQAKIDDVETYSATMISKVLRTLGLNFSADTISAHRKHECRCKR